MNKHNPLRRTVLRSAVAGGCVLGLPLLAGCKGEEQSGQAPGGTGAPTPSEPPSTPTEPPSTPSAPATEAPAAPADEAPSSPATEPPPSTQPSDAPATSPQSEGGAAGQKVSQAQAQYQSTPKGDDKCSNCQNFIAESNTCKVVEGEVSPEGWCTLYVKAT